MTGFYNAFSIAQKGWNKSFMFPLLSLFRFNNLENQIHSIYVIIIMFFSLLHIKKIPLSLQCLIWLNLLLPLTAGSTISIGRYCIVLFPIFYLSSMYFYKLGKFRYLLLLLLLSVQLYFFQYWTIADSLSY